ncbi:unnamed protein product [Phytophthora fragariaefolia]|uniref:Unnamed protein product n=1 Tax=Phytophthora fragariaefolia TaxID=1490495 RepID=A0A9W6Y4G5_9STRA|nr:unnamed protein product [Phytophthora fragariaefolia]
MYVSIVLFHAVVLPMRHISEASSEEKRDSEDEEEGDVADDLNSDGEGEVGGGAEEEYDAQDAEPTEPVDEDKTEGYNRDEDDCNAEEKDECGGEVDGVETPDVDENSDADDHVSAIGSPTTCSASGSESGQDSGQVDLHSDPVLSSAAASRVSQMLAKSS